MVFQLTQKLVFPDPHYGEPDGLLAVGGDLSVDLSLIHIYMCIRDSRKRITLYTATLCSS